MRRVRAVSLVILVTATPRAGSADPLALPGATPRSLGRAGACVVATDDAAALQLNPAGLARRTTLRAEVSLTLVDRDATAESFVLFDPPMIAAHDLSPSSAAPAALVAVGLGERVTLGVALSRPVALAYEYALPAGAAATAFDPASPDGHVYPHRYAGARLALRSTSASLGAGARVTSWLAAGASLSLSRVELAHTRVLWAGDPAGMDAIDQLSPAWDMTFSASGEAYTPSATLGVLVAPLDVPLELGASVAWRASATIDGAPALTDTRGRVGAMDTPRLATAAVDPGARARLELPLPTSLRAGARFLTARAALELDAELWFVGSEPAHWTLDGVSVTPEGGAAAALPSVPVAPPFQDGYALRGALEVVALPGVLVATAGYGFERRLVPVSGHSPLFPGGDAHVLALGLEARAGGATISLSAARVVHDTARVPRGAGGATVLTPLAASAIPAADGAYDASATIVSLGLELER